MSLFDRKPSVIIYFNEESFEVINHSGSNLGRQRQTDGHQVPE